MFSKDLFFSGTIKVGSVWLSVNQRETLAANEKFNQSKKKKWQFQSLSERGYSGVKKRKCLLSATTRTPFPAIILKKKNESVPGS